MNALFVSFYLIPASLVFVWLLLIRLALNAIALPVRVRRLVFSIVAALTLAPMIVPAGTIMTALVPNALLLLSGSPPMLHQQRLVEFALMSFGITAVIALALSFGLFRPSRKPLRQRWSAGRLASIAAPGVGIVIAAAIMAAVFPGRDVPAHVDAELIERHYGRFLDRLAATVEIDDLDEVISIRRTIAAEIAEDPLVLKLRFHDDRLRDTAASNPAVFTLGLPGRKSGSGCSSATVGGKVQKGLMRCTWWIDGARDIETLRYRRVVQAGQKNETIEIEFDYRQFARHYRRSVAP